MTKGKCITAQILLGALAIYANASANDTLNSNQERCFGIAKTGLNDCAASAHACAAQAKEDNNPFDWMWVKPKTCQSQGGELTPPHTEPE